VRDSYERTMNHRPPAIVIVETDSQLRAIFAVWLQYTFPAYTAYACQTQHEALAYLQHATVGCVLTEYHLPDGDGITLAMTIQGRWPTVPVVLATTTWTPLLRTTALAAGCAAYLNKPVTPALLTSTLQPLLVVPPS
jgi:CheY-like chemotaxis protein